MRRIFRYEVPVDDAWHTFTTGTVIHVATRDRYKVEFWAYEPTDSRKTTREFRVFGTGHPIPDNVYLLGTALAPDSIVVWHLFFRVPSELGKAK